METPVRKPEDEPGIVPFVATWAAEILGRSKYGHAVKVMVTFEEEPGPDQEAVVRSQVQAVMHRQYAVWCTAVTYRKWKL